MNTLIIIYIDGHIDIFIDIFILIIYIDGQSLRLRGPAIN